MAALLREYGFEGKRGVQYQGGKDSADVTGLPGFHIEVKRTEKLNLEAAMAQARADCGTDRNPVVFHRKSKNGWVVVLDAPAFLQTIVNYEKLRDMLVKSCERQVNLPVVVKPQPEDSDWERLKEKVAELVSENRRLQDELDSLEPTREDL